MMNREDTRMTFPDNQTAAIQSREPRHASVAVATSGCRTGAAQQPPVIGGSGLRKTFGKTVALDRVDIAVQPGETVAIMGPSGSGKSTLLHCLAGILMPDDGVVLLQGQRIDKLGERQRSGLRRSRFGFVFQDHQLLPELPADENVALPLMLGGTRRADAVSRARDMLQAVGLSGLERRRPGQLSGGEAQRVAVARALVIDPLVVFADEPTGSLDQTTGRDTLRLLVEHATRQSAALIIVTHDSGVAAHCDRIVEVRDGRLRPAASNHSTMQEAY